MKKKFLLVLMMLCFCLICTDMAVAGVSIAIEKTTNQLYFYNNEMLTNTFPVATGRSQVYTPEGSFTIVTKVIDPYYGKTNIPGGSPYNPLGYRWLGLSEGQGYIYGIHGTNDPSSIGTYASAGCVRMYNEDVNWLYNNTPIGTPVLIAQTIEHPIQKPVVFKLGTKEVTIEKPIGACTNGTPLLPLKPIFEQLGYSISWDNTNNTVTAIRKKEQIVIDCINGKVVTKEQTFNCPDLLLAKDSAYGPLYVFKQAIPWLELDWNPETRQVTGYIK